MTNPNVTVAAREIISKLNRMDNFSDEYKVERMKPIIQRCVDEAQVKCAAIAFAKAREMEEIKGDIDPEYKGGLIEGARSVGYAIGLPPAPKQEDE